MSGGTAPEDAALFPLSDDERIAVAAVVEAYAAALPADVAERYLRVAEAARSGEVPASDVEALEGVCTLALQTGKARELGRAEAERVLFTVLRRAPGARAMAGALEQVNEALSGLAGRRLRSVRASMRLPGRYVLVLEVDGVTMTLGLGPDGLGVESLAAG